ncbi:FAD-dependent oxidoreductase [Glaciecola sp. MF2-115]|uniref:FAD-dependent oxidoreductase n=1 Tax=Glaciecola sp. MF2-115 TaxID=3384827 RepID=UPI0039A21C69
MKLSVDYCILGGGMVGCATAIGLSKLGYKVAIVEAHKPKAYNAKDLPDLRVSALNRYTQSLLQSYKVWDKVVSMRCKQYQRLSVWEDISRPLHFDASEIGESYLGYFVENRILQLALLDTIEQEHSNSIQVFYAKAADIQLSKSSVLLDNDTQISANIFVGADGGHSQLRQAANIGTTGWQYEQQANVLLVKMHSDFEAATWQQFTPSGPVAFLPLFDNYASLVWYADSPISQDIRLASNEEIRKQVITRFPSILGDFEVIDKTGFPLRRMHANQYWRNNVVLVGDAAHQINPLAGQGVNLGFKDVGALVESIKNNPIYETNKQAFIDYENERRSPNLLMMSAMDVFYQTFSNNIGPLRVIRNAGIQIANLAGPIKQKALKYAMGFE